MLNLTAATVEAFLKSLEEQEYSAATISKYAHDVRTLLRYAPEGIADRETLNGFRACTVRASGRALSSGKAPAFFYRKNCKSPS